ncbi:hypothetical protein L7L32_005633 [Klebsiella pneumoniae]|nr:hypothetical protein [Klebsiella pneumoniae]
MTSKLTRERLEQLADNNTICKVSWDERIELAQIALAAMDSEPVAWTDEQELRDVDRGGCGYLFTVNPVTPHADERRIILLYRHAQPVPRVPDGYVMVPVKPTREILDEFDSIIDYGAEDSEDAWRRLLAAAPQEVKP